MDNQTPPHSELYDSPRDGIPEVVTTTEQLRQAAALIGSGTGAVAIDTERANMYRYDDRAFLLQLRREGSGTVLIAPEDIRADIAPILGPVLANLRWVLHSAKNDLACLAALGLRPRQLSDTEIAAHLLGAPATGLGPVVEHYLGYHLPKNHSTEDWSEVPLPPEWLEYAALDVELLLPLARTLEQQLEQLGREEWYLQECAHVVQHYSDASFLEHHFSSLKNLHELRGPIELSIARALWELREDYAREEDIAPHRVLPHWMIILLAKRRARTVMEIKQQLAHKRIRTPLTPGEMAAAIKPAIAHPTTKPADFRSPPPAWTRDKATKVAVSAAVDEAQGHLDELAHRLDISRGVIISAKTLRSTIAAIVVDKEPVDGALQQAGLRPWQMELIGRILVQATGS